MKKCVVSLVSDQTIPNILIAAHYAPDHLLFLTTRSMEDRGKSEAILQTLALRGQDYSVRHQKIEVAPDSIVDLQNKIAEWVRSNPEDFHFIVNLTGGTKLMSIAAYDVFMDFGSEMVYLADTQKRNIDALSQTPAKTTGRLCREALRSGVSHRLWIQNRQPEQT